MPKLYGPMTVQLSLGQSQLEEQHKTLKLYEVEKVQALPAECSRELLLTAFAVASYIRGTGVCLRGATHNVMRRYGTGEIVFVDDSSWDEASPGTVVDLTDLGPAAAGA